MKKVICICFFIFVIMTNSVLANEEVSLSDISGHWAEESILKMVDMGVISGYPDGTFKPDNNVTRAELAKILSISFDLVDSYSLDEFEDIDETKWYYPYLQKSARYIPKYRLPVYYPSMAPYLSTEGKFLPDNDAVRMHVAEALVEIMLETENIDIEVPSVTVMWEDVNKTFKDGYELFVIHNGQPASNAARMIKYTWLANELGIMQGYDDGYFYPYGYVTRAELMTIIDRML